jgi:hypothetical protein
MPLSGREILRIWRCTSNDVSEASSGSSVSPAFRLDLSLLLLLALRRLIGPDQRV